MSRVSHYRGYLTIAGGVLVHLALGTVYTIGNMIPYMVSYLRVYSQTKTIRYRESIWVQSAALAGQAVGMGIGGVIALRLSTRKTTLIGCLIMSAGVGLSYFTIQHSFWLLLLTYGFVFGVGVGIGYTPPFACAMKWLPAKKGLASGLVLAGFGGGAFVFNQIQTAYINPDNLTPNEVFSSNSNEKYFTQTELLSRVPFCFLILCGAFVGIQLIGIALISDPLPDEIYNANIDIEPQTEETVSKYTAIEDKFHQSGVDNMAYASELHTPPGEVIYLRPTRDTSAVDEQHQESERNSQVGEENDVKVAQLVRTREFWTLYFTLLLNGSGIILVTSMYKAFGQTFISDDHFLSLVGSFSALFNSLGRPFWGFLGDNFTYKVAMMILCSAMCLLLFTLSLTALGGKAMFFIWICAFYFSLCGNYALMPAVVSRTFGPARVGVNYGLIFTSQIVTSVVGAELASQLFDAIGWFGVFHVTGGAVFISLLLTSTFNGRKPDGSPV